MNDLIVALILVVIISLAIWYVVSQKKKGAKCIGCSACSSKSANEKKEDSTDTNGCSGCNH